MQTVLRVPADPCLLYGNFLKVLGSQKIRLINKFDGIDIFWMLLHLKLLISASGVRAHVFGHSGRP